MGQRWKRQGIAASVLVVLGVALTPVAAQAQNESSLRSWNFPDRYVRHRSSLGYIDPIAKSDRLGRVDGTFRIVPGLAGTCRSFESVNYPGYFLRHQNFRLKLAPRADDDLFKKDATFCFRSGLASSGGTSFESLNFPGHFIRHLNFELWIARFDGTALFRKDATFLLSPSLRVHGPAGPIDGGTNLVPADD